MIETIANINWTAFNLAILIGLAIMGAYGFVMFCGNKRIERKHKEWERRCRELRGEIWADLQKQIDAYRKPDAKDYYIGVDVADDYEKAGKTPSGYIDSRDYYRVMEKYEKAGERE